MQAGLIVLHSNRLENLADVSLAWLARHPLAPLETETFLVHSNGMAEWLKMRMAQSLGVSAAFRVELPARFLWRLTRSVLGRDAVPPMAPTDREPLTWRFMARLPEWLAQPGLELLRERLAGADAAQRLSWSRRLADLFDQYQVHRPDWLADWAAGRAVLQPGRGPAQPVPDDQLWQPQLWQAVVRDLGDCAQAQGRAALQQRLLNELAAAPSRPAGLPRRVVVFGISQMPTPVLAALAEVARHSQVIVALLNPCRYHWADTLAGREFFASPRRLPLRGGVDHAHTPLEALQSQGHPLLNAWGHQGRDFIRQWDAFEDVLRLGERSGLTLEHFDVSPPRTWLEQVQAAVRDLQRLAEHPRRLDAVAADDRSIVFHSAHSPQREVEVLHDQILHWLAHPPGGTALAPRDIVVMVPDIDRYAAAIASVFGQHDARDERHVPWSLSDQRDSGRPPLLRALEWLLRIHEHRFTQSELRTLLETPALAARFELRADELPGLLDWIAGAGLRWGLNAAQREALALGTCGELGSWRWALDRMLAGYALGARGDDEPLPAPLDGVEPYGEIGGLAAPVVGKLAELVGQLEAWWQTAREARHPADWATALRALLEACFAPQDETERDQVAGLWAALEAWLHSCEAAGFDEAVGLPVARDAWLSAYQAPQLETRFKSGGVTFCTLLPMRAIPFEIVCLLGMNEGDYPRPSTRVDFDLMARPGMLRPGDRSRQRDDRQLMLDALLSARRVFSVSWCGRSVRDNQAQPPSVLVGQLRDYLAAGWDERLVQERTTEHPLQAFSPRYFAQDKPAHLFTYAREWRHALELTSPASGPHPAPTLPEAGTPGPTVTLTELVRFLKKPVESFFRTRLQVQFDDLEEGAADDEVFALDALATHQLMGQLIESWQQGGLDASRAAARLARLGRQGELPLGGPGTALAEAHWALLQPMLQAWAQHTDGWAPMDPDATPGALRLEHPEHPGLALEATLPHVHRDADGRPRWAPLGAHAVKQNAKTKKPAWGDLKGKHLIEPYLTLCAAAAADQPMPATWITRDAVLHLPPLAPDTARDTLRHLLRAYLASTQAPGPWPADAATGYATLAQEAKRATSMTPEADAEPAAAKAAKLYRPEHDAALARCYPSYRDLQGHPAWADATTLLYGPLAAWAASITVDALPTP
ncbi:exodeoxyribonuclease V subunit gamma [Inhella gelatinilytica]|uniref:RecBCD enzyme subunit RecC n=1 Tax=Inhella gelatinilytica TaxID=2795030 RepID=A0A931J0A5_9BURK|nr:exodeoxyribonuclease V subunit gamma [Inhella gelatinilytica]MBH9554295.1 exodeoxyribonuclease V subunit gamma [Inhella gelatinilytica]